MIDVYYYQPSWWSKVKQTALASLSLAVDIQFDTGLGIGSLPMNLCGTEGWFHKKLWTMKSNFGVTFTTDNNICQKGNFYFLQVSKLGLTVSVQTNDDLGCSGTVTYFDGNRTKKYKKKKIKIKI